MLAIGVPDHCPARVCHSLRMRSGVRYSVRMSVNPPVTWRVTIFTPFTAGLGNTIELSDRMMVRKSGIKFFSLAWAGRMANIVLGFKRLGADFNVALSCLIGSFNESY